MHVTCLIQRDKRFDEPPLLLVEKLHAIEQPVALIKAIHTGAGKACSVLTCGLK